MFLESLHRAFLASIFALTACSSGGVGTSSAVGGTGIDNPGTTDPSVLPTTGIASYAGFLSLKLPAGPQPGSVRATYTGALGLEVDFAQVSGQLTGSADGFRGASGTSLSGRIFVTDGTLDRSASVSKDYTFEAGVSGTLNGDGLRNSVVTGTMTGDFIGENAASVSGVAFGAVTTVLGVDVFDGSFAATQN